MRSSNYVIYSRIPDSDNTIMLHGYRGTVDIVPNDLARLLMSSSKQINQKLFSEVSPETIQMLSSRGYLTELSSEQELEFFKRIASAIHSNTRKTHFAPMIIPTYSCNLRCFYCFQDHLHNEKNGLYQLGRSNVISRDMVDAAFESIERLRPVESTGPVSLGLYGGEPFLAENRPVVEYIIRTARGKGYKVGAISNSSELDAYYDLLGPDGISGIQITLDGDKNSHDGRRICADGSGTYEVISKNVTEALNRGVSISLRINVDKDNVGELPALTRKFVDNGWTGFRNFRAYTAPLHSYEVARFSSNMTQSQLADALDQVKGELAYPLSSTQKSTQEGTFAQFFNKTGQGWGPFKTGVCSAVFGMYMFDPYGDVYACWDEAGNKDHRVGTYGKGFIELNRDRLAAWLDRSISEVDQCSKCSYALVCGGGCAYLAAEDKGTYYASYCDNFQRNFRKSMVSTYLKIQNKGSVCETSAHSAEGAVCA